MSHVSFFHADLDYAYLTPDRHEFVIRKAYIMIFDMMRERFTGTAPSKPQHG